MLKRGWWWESEINYQCRTGTNYTSIQNTNKNEYEFVSNLEISTSKLIHFFFSNISPLLLVISFSEPIFPLSNKNFTYEHIKTGVELCFQGIKSTKVCFFSYVQVPHTFLKKKKTFRMRKELLILKVLWEDLRMNTQKNYTKSKKNFSYRKIFEWSPNNGMEEKKKLAKSLRYF